MSINVINKGKYMENYLSKKIIALITDFGTRDAYAAVMKAVLLKANPALSIIDITHEVNPFNIESVSFLLYSSWDYFPQNTIFLSVVDPGVGSERNILLAEQKGKILIAPDNGSVTLLYNKKDNFRVWTPSLKALSLIPAPESSTFHGRDIFAPLAGLISLQGIETVAGEAASPVLLNTLKPVLDKKIHTIRGRIIHIDRFGNCISSISAEDFPETRKTGKSGNAGKTEESEDTEITEKKGKDKKTAKLKTAVIKTESTEIKGIEEYFARVPEGKALSYFGSTGFLEIAVNMGNASEILKIKAGDGISVYY